MKRHRLGITAIVIAALALALAILPGMIVDGPSSAGKAEYLPKQPVAAEPDEPATEPKYSLRVGRWKFGIGRQTQPQETTVPKAEPPPPSIEAPPVDRGSEILRWTTVGSLALGIVGLVLGPIAWAKERRRELPRCAIAMSLLAMFWPYIAAGVLLGVTIVVVVILLLIVASNFS